MNKNANDDSVQFRDSYDALYRAISKDDHIVSPSKSYLFVTHAFSCTTDGSRNAHTYACLFFFFFVRTRAIATWVHHSIDKNVASQSIVMLRYAKYAIILCSREKNARCAKHRCVKNTRELENGFKRLNKMQDTMDTIELEICSSRNS